MEEKESEINSIDPVNYDVCAERTFVKEFEVVNERKSFDIQKRMNEFSQKKQEQKAKQKNRLKTILTTFLVGVVSLTTLITPLNQDYKDIIQNYYIEGYDEGIMYSFEFAEDKDFRSLKINVFNDFVCYTEDVEDNVIENFVEPLKPNMKYTLTITNGGTTIFKKEVTTKTLRQTSDKPNNW